MLHISWIFVPSLKTFFWKIFHVALQNYAPKPPVQILWKSRMGSAIDIQLENVLTFKQLLSGTTRTNVAQNQIFLWAFQALGEEILCSWFCMLTMMLARSEKDKNLS